MDALWEGMESVWFGTEPCLTLDVYTPAVVNTPGSSAASPFRLAVDSGLPVMVFIEGGGFLVGDKYQQGIYDARKLAQKQNIIVVSVNYRLGVFGWLHHPYLKNEAGEVLANFGLRDQLQALQWVQKNIAAFGGDPSRVTLVGESAGAMSICAHLASPTSRGFFHSAVLESGNCDGLFIWQPRKYAEDYGLRYMRGVFGRIRGCYLSELSHNTTYKASQNGCSTDDTAPMKLVRDLCRNLFFGGYEEVTMRVMADILPFENVGGCDTDYRGCKADLPSGLELDQALLKCAERLPTKYVWVNQFALIHHYTRSDSSYISKFMGMGWFGAPPPPHLPWAPIVDLDFQGELDFAGGSGLASLPLHSYEGMNSRLQMRTITSGFNRDEGSLFYLLLPNFFSGIDTKNGLSDTDYRKLLKSMACPDWGPACTKPGCVEPAECEERVDTAVKAYQWEPSVSALRGRCCSTDPNTLRVQRMLTDMLFVCPNFRFLRQMHNHSDATLRTYQFAADDEVPAWLPPLRSLLGAFHFSELFFVMGDKEGPGGNLPLSGGALGFGLGWTKQDVRISSNMSGSWGALVRGEELPSWPTWDSGQMNRFVLGVPNNVDIMPMESMIADHHCDFFDGLN
ncbi:ACHE, partial [Symbiodinium sp. KB8]